MGFNIPPHVPTAQHPCRVDKLLVDRIHQPNISIRENCGHIQHVGQASLQSRKCPAKIVLSLTETRESAVTWIRKPVANTCFHQTLTSEHSHEKPTVKLIPSGVMETTCNNGIPKRFVLYVLSTNKHFAYLLANCRLRGCAK